MSQILKMSMNNKGWGVGGRQQRVLGTKGMVILMLVGMVTREQLTLAKDLATIDMESSAYEIVKKHHHAGSEHSPDKPIMKIDIREGGPLSDEEKELVHQKEDADPEKFQRKTRHKRDVEDIFLLDGSR